MKKSIFTLSLLFFVIQSFCQNFNSSEIQWNVVSLHVNASPNFPNNVDTTTKTYGYQNDTIIDNLVWQTIYRADDEAFTENLIPLGYLRQENGIVNFIDTTNTNHQLYNFNLVEGDSVLYFPDLGVEYKYVYVEFIDSLLVNGIYKKQIHFEQSIFPPYLLNEIWIEDIGSIHGPLFPAHPEHYSYEIPNEKKLICCADGNNLIWHHPEYNACFYHSVLPAIPFVEDGKQWNVKFISGGNPDITEIYRFEGDSIVNNHVYNIIRLSYDSLNSYSASYLFREESNIVYTLINSDTEAIVYNFNLSIGDTAEVYSPFGYDYTEIIVTDISFIEYEGFYRQKYTIESLYDNFYEEYWIEGIGSSFGPIHSRVYTFIICPDWTLTCAYSENEQIYQLEGASCYYDPVGIKNIVKSNLQTYPNPMSSGQNLYITNNIRIKNIQIIDYSGKRIKSIVVENSNNKYIETQNLKKGVYILKIEDINGNISTTKMLVI